MSGPDITTRSLDAPVLDPTMLITLAVAVILPAVACVKDPGLPLLAAFAQE